MAEPFTRHITPHAEFTVPNRHQANHAGPVRWLMSHALRHWRWWLLLIFGALANALLAAVVPVFIGQAFNGILAHPPEVGILLRSALLILFSQLLRSTLQLSRNFSAELIGQRMERDIRDEVYVSLLGKSMAFHGTQPVGDTMARATNDVREINFMFNPGVNLVIGSLMFIIMPLVVAPRYHPALLLAPTLFAFTYVLALARYLHELEPVTQQVRTRFGRMNTRLAEALDGIETVKGAAQESSEVRRFQKAAQAFRDAFVHQGDIEARFLPLMLLALTTSGGFLHSVLLYRQGLLVMGDIVAYMGLLQLLGFPTFISLFAYSRISSGIAAAKRILQLITAQTHMDQNAGGYARKMQGSVTFSLVDFSYHIHERPVLNQISFSIKPGQRVALVGQTGSGKTTLVKLINRTHDVTGGQVLVDGHDVREWDMAALRRQISIIEQDIFLFSRTIAENIAFGRPKATQTEIENAARAAQAHEFIQRFNHGYQTIIGERGVTLSGGQRQRLALARAFLTNPAILILDDSTSAIDSATEDKIQRAIFAAAKGRTTFIITHRLSQIRWADVVIVLRQGRIEALGNHETLLQSSPAYQRLFAS
jgi:ATP-binding cassette subfamily B protein